MPAERVPWRWAKIGYTLERYAADLERQQGGCAICRKPPSATRRLDVDHDHKLGHVRGLLCHVCNRRLWVGATPAQLRAAADYLERTTP